MSSPSNWPLPSAGRRYLTPASILRTLREHPLTRGCHPIAMGYYPQATGHVMQRELHDDYLLIFCSAGHGTLQEPGGGQAVGPGDIVMLPRGEAHSYRASDADPWTLYWVHFSGEAANEFVRYLRGSHGPVRHSGVEPTLVSGFEALLAAASSGYRLGSYVSASNRLRQLLTEFALYCDRRPSARLGRIDVESLQGYMRDKVGGRVTLAELAALAHLSPQHFASRYRERTGVPPLQHFQQMKIQAACQLLDSTEDSVKAIAARLGYADPLYFSRVFRRTQGLSPSAYRESQRR